MQNQKFAVILALIVCCLLNTVDRISACYIWGTDSGTCTGNSINPLWRAANMPFCQDAVQYSACIPAYETLPPNRQFPLGRWYNNTVTVKDAWVQAAVNNHINDQISQENNGSLFVKRRFYKKIDCQTAFKNYFCWINFPRCDQVQDLSLPTCRSACLNFFKACGYDKKLWRCGPARFFNGYAPESPTIKADGNVTYLRDFFPGQPFRNNRYTPAGHQYAVCTPAIDGSGWRGIRGSGGGYRDLGLLIGINVIVVSVTWLWMG